MSQSLRRVAIFIALSMGAPAHAQQPYPIKTIRMIVPFAPDGIGQH